MIKGITNSKKTMPSHGVSLRTLERMLWWFLFLIGILTVWVGTWLESRTNQSSWRATQVHGSIPNQAKSYRSTSSVVYGKHLWSNNSVIPDWMQGYMDWHFSVVTTLTPDNWRQYKYLILRCHRKDERCGGVSDRLKPVPLTLLAAHRSQRILFIDWDRPCPLTEFLIPPIGGFLWTAPSFMIPILREDSNRALTRAATLIDKCQELSSCLVYTHLHDTLGGMTQYDQEFGAGSFQTIYHDLFRIFFRPSPSLQTLIERYLVTDPTKASNATLVEGQYSVAHFRAEYGKEVLRHPVLTEPSFLQHVTFNSIRCASELQPSERRIPIYFASDNAIAMETARQMANKFHYPIITFPRSEDSPRRLDDYDDQTQPSDYYSTFVDLYLAGSGKCVTHGRGGFGRFASLLSFNVSCSSKHVKQFFPAECLGRPPFELQLQNSSRSD